MGAGQGVVDVAGLGVTGSAHPLLPAGQIADPQLVRQLPHLGPLAVVEDPRLVRMGDPPGRAGGGGDEIDRLVIGRDEDVDGRTLGWWRRLTAVAGPAHGQREQADVDEDIGLGDHEGQRDPPGIPVDRGVQRQER